MFYTKPDNTLYITQGQQQRLNTQALNEEHSGKWFSFRLKEIKLVFCAQQSGVPQQLHKIMWVYKKQQ